MEKTFLIFAYYSYRDPIFQSAVLPYFLNFPEKEKFRFVVLTFEHNAYPMSQDEVEHTSRYLQSHNIVWKRSRWRSGKYKGFKKMLDALSALLTSVKLIREFKIKNIYAEGWPGAILAYYIAKLSGSKLILHSFEPHADYMVEAGTWQNSSWETKIVRWHEKAIAKKASLIFTATQNFIDKLKNDGIADSVLHRCPSCVDLEHFMYDATARISVRNSLGIQQDDLVLVYLGKFGGMYMEEEAFEFFKLCQEKLNVWIMIISGDSRQKISTLAQNFSLDHTRLTSVFLDRDKVPLFLSAADIGLVAVRQCPSKKYCSPIKTGEYLACGLPVIVPRGISDDDTTLERLKLAILINTLKKSEYLQVINEWSSRINENVDRVRKRARDYVASDRSVVRYRKLFSELFEKL